MQDRFRIPLLFAFAAPGIGLAECAMGQDASRGQSVFKICAACHAADHSNRMGPGLMGVVGRKAGTASGFHFSHAMTRSKIIWDAKILNAYIAEPQKVVPGNLMPYGGMKSDQDRADLIAYLETLK